MIHAVSPLRIYRRHPEHSCRDSRRRYFRRTWSMGKREIVLCKGTSARERRRVSSRKRRIRPDAAPVSSALAVVRISFLVATARGWTAIPPTSVLSDLQFAIKGTRREAVFPLRISTAAKRRLESPRVFLPPPQDGGVLPSTRSIAGTTSCGPRTRMIFDPGALAWMMLRTRLNQAVVSSVAGKFTASCPLM